MPEGSDLYRAELSILSSARNYRVRHVTVYYYLEDDTCQVIEPRQLPSPLRRLPPNERVSLLDESAVTLCACGVSSDVLIRQDNSGIAQGRDLPAGQHSQPWAGELPC